MAENKKDFNVEDVISKSLDDIEEMVKSLEEKEEDTISKGMDDKDEDAKNVSEDAPEDGDNQDNNQDDNQDEDADNEGEEDADQDDDYEKSLSNELNKNENARKALEVSEFLQELVKSLDVVLSKAFTSTDGINKSITDSANNSNELLAKSVQGLVKANKAVLDSNKRVQKSLDDISGRLAKIEKQPMTRKSVASSKAQPIEKSFEASLGGEPTPSNKLSKGQAVATLTKSWREGNKAVQNDILALESTGNFETLSAEAKSLLGMQ